ncbi:high affinity copper uptake protein 1-like [Suncus etruscus]|uniref:high affinity copper uptake protein 1-like n=1 Tax=Suncus etruscus TaxID=109475 RepID=UPI002110DE73|nr:high affinity copper uptake protein 1-like [Suncus etruscus]
MYHLHHHEDTSVISSTPETSTSTLLYGFTMPSAPHAHGGGHTDNMSMHTTFYFGYKNVELLFPGLVIQCRAGMVLACLVMFCLALCYEGLKVAREKLTDRAKSSPQPHVLRWLHLAQTALHVLQMMLSYVLMLTFMTYNAYLALAVWAGAGTGYLVFRWKNARLLDPASADPCH